MRFAGPRLHGTHQCTDYQCHITIDLSDRRQIYCLWRCPKAQLQLRTQFRLLGSGTSPKMERASKRAKHDTNLCGTVRDISCHVASRQSNSKVTPGVREWYRDHVCVQRWPWQGIELHIPNANLIYRPCHARNVPASELQ